MVTVCVYAVFEVNHASHRGQLSLIVSPWVRNMSAGMVTATARKETASFA